MKMTVESDTVIYEYLSRTQYIHYVTLLPRPCVPEIAAASVGTQHGQRRRQMRLY